MKVISQSKSNLVLVLKKGEVYPDVLVDFLKRRKIKGSFFFGLGAVSDPEIAYYDMKKKKYLNKKFRGVFEAARFTGNSALLDGKPVVHNHVVLGKRNYEAFAGHLNKTKIGGTLELYLIKTGALKRKADKKTGLNLLIKRLP